MTNWLKLGLSAALAFTLLSATLALAHTIGFDDGVIDSAKEIHGVKHHQHGDTAGHLTTTNSNIQLVSKLKLKNVVPEKIADVSVYGNYAYLAAWGVVTCKYNGVHVVNIANPAQPKEVAFLGAKEGSYPGEGVQALSISTPAYTGKILVSNNETCNEKTGFGGLNIYDINKPNQPVALAEGIGDFTVNGQGKKAANEIHSVFAWDAGDNAYAVIVDNEEEPDVDIIDITNPKRPRKIAEYDLDQQFPQIKEGALSEEVLFEIFHHDVVVKKIDGRYEMLVSYWDGGYVKLDVTDPRNATYIGDTDFTAIDGEAAESGLTTGDGTPVPPEGNAHESEFTKDNAYVVAADEDFNPYNLVAENVNDGTAINGGQGSATPPLTEGQQISGPSTFVGLACPGGAPVPSGGAGTQIAVVERGVCTFTEKVASVEAAGGYEAILVFNRTAADGCSSPINMAVEGNTPTFGVATREQGFAIFNATYDHAACLAGNGTQTAPFAVGALGDTLNFESYFDGWGYVHLYENEAGKMTELDTYAIPEAHDEAYAQGFGDVSVHEVATSKLFPERQYYSYYSGGVRVTEIQNDQLVEVGAWIDPNGGNNFWGIDAFTRTVNDQKVEYFAGSDRDHGLYIFRYTGD